MITNGETDLDEKGNDIDLYISGSFDENGTYTIGSFTAKPERRKQVTARLSRDLKPLLESRYQHGERIRSGLTVYDENGKYIKPECRNEEAARLFRESIRLPESKFRLVYMIYIRKTDRDENGTYITTIAQRNEVFARLYRGSKELLYSRFNLARMIYESETDLDENGCSFGHNRERIIAVDRLSKNVFFPDMYYLKALVRYRYGEDTIENLTEINTNIEHALSKGYSRGLPLYSLIQDKLAEKQQASKLSESLEEQMNHPAASSRVSIGHHFHKSGSNIGLSDPAEIVEESMLLFEEQTDEYGYLSDEDAKDLPMDTKVSSTKSVSLELSLSEYRARQRQRVADRNEAVERKRQEGKTRWLEEIQEAKRGYVNPAPITHADKTSDFKEIWEQSTISERLTLAREGFSDRINLLIEDIKIDGRRGKPESLTGDYHEWMSRRISQEHRLIYKVKTIGEQRTITIKACGGHY